MTPNEYQSKAWSFALPQARNEQYLRLGLLSEIGEIAALFKRKIRDGADPNFRDKLRDEIGDCLWYAVGLVSLINFKIEDYAASWQSITKAGCDTHRANVASLARSLSCGWLIDVCFGVIHRIAPICKEYDLTLEECAEANIAKLADRKDRGVINGKGDER